MLGLKIFQTFVLSINSYFSKFKFIYKSPIYISNVILSFIRVVCTSCLHWAPFNTEIKVLQLVMLGNSRIPQNSKHKNN